MAYVLSRSGVLVCMQLCVETCLKVGIVMDLSSSSAHKVAQCCQVAVVIGEDKQLHTYSMLDTLLCQSLV